MKTPYVESEKSARDYFSELGLSNIVEAADGVDLGVNEKLETRKPYKPNLIDLCRLHRFVMETKRTTVLEFGTGWSTWVVADALERLEARYAKDVRGLRRNNIFELHVVDDEEEFIGVASNRLPPSLCDRVFFNCVPVQMTTFNGRVCSVYEKLPLISPDFIYVDGPDQFNVVGHVDGWSTRHNDMMPMSSDVLKIEHFLTPGTIVVFDGRAANARFFYANVQRNWSYQYDSEYDQHVFLLDEDALGKYNKMQLDFYSI